MKLHPVNYGERARDMPPNQPSESTQMVSRFSSHFGNAKGAGILNFKSWAPRLLPFQA